MLYLGETFVSPIFIRKMWLYMSDNNELKCSVCGKLASEDSHFYKSKMLCNRHYLQMYRHGKILSEDENI